MIPSSLAYGSHKISHGFPNVPGLTKIRRNRGRFVLQARDFRLPGQTHSVWAMAERVPSAAQEHRRGLYEPQLSWATYALPGYVVTETGKLSDSVSILNELATVQKNRNTHTGYSPHIIIRHHSSHFLSDYDHMRYDCKV